MKFRIRLVVLIVMTAALLHAAEEIKGKRGEEAAKARVTESRERGKAFEDEVKGRLEKPARGRFEDQVTVRSAETGRISRPDFVVRRSDGELVAVEAKAGETARLSKGQRALREEGGIVVSSTKEGVKPGDRIGPKRVAVVRDEKGNRAAARRQ
jgi:hypothetical protein